MSVKRRATTTMPDEPLPMIDELGEVRELTAEDFKDFRPSSDFPVLVDAFQRARGERGPQKSPTKSRVGLRLDQEVVEHFRATGPGWQSRINDVLVEHVKRTRV